MQQFKVRGNAVIKCFVAFAIFRVAAMTSLQLQEVRVDERERMRRILNVEYPRCRMGLIACCFTRRKLEIVSCLCSTQIVSKFPLDSHWCVYL